MSCPTTIQQAVASLVGCKPHGDGYLVHTTCLYPSNDAVRVLVRGGRLALCFNDKDAMLAWPGHVHGFRLYSTEEVEAMLATAGFAALRTVSDSDARQGLFHCVSAYVV